MPGRVSRTVLKKGRFLFMAHSIIPIYHLYKSLCMNGL